MLLKLCDDQKFDDAILTNLTRDGADIMMEASQKEGSQAAPTPSHRAMRAAYVETVIRCITRVQASVTNSWPQWGRSQP